MLKWILMGMVCLVPLSSAMAGSSLFSVSESGLDLSIRTTVPNHTYASAGFKILNASQYHIANPDSSCQQISSGGNCIFSVSDTAPWTVALSGNAGVVQFQLCLNGTGQGTSCQNYSQTINGYSIGGSVFGLTAAGLVLQNNGGDNLSVAANSTAFQFASLVPYNGSYNVSVLSQPVRQFCNIGNASGTNVTANVSNVTTNCSEVPIAYVSSDDNHTEYYCPLNASDTSANGSVSSCTATAPDQTVAGWSPFAIAFATVNGVLRGYVADNDSDRAKVCEVVSSTGALHDCVETGDTLSGSPTGITTATINGNQYAYVSDNVSSHIYRCAIAADGSLENCINAPLFYPPGWWPFATTMATVNGTSYAYVANADDGTVYRCTINASGLFPSCVDVSNPVSLGTVNAVAFATVNGTQYIYVPDSVSGGNIQRCSLNNAGEFDSCLSALSSPPSWNPRGVAFATVNGTQYAYVADINGAVYQCTLNSNGSFDVCAITPTSGAPTDWQPRGVTLAVVPA